MNETERDKLDAARKQRKQDIESTRSLKKRLNKLSVAKQRANTLAKRDKALDLASALKKDIDTKIKTIAVDGLVVRKVSKLKELGKTFDEINSIYDELSNIEITESGKFTSLKYFKVDRKFAGLSTQAILKKIGHVSPKPEETEQIEEKTQNSKTPKPKPKKKEKSLAVKTNPDTNTVSDVKRNNEKIYDYLVKKGEVQIAKYIGDLIFSSEPNDVKKISDLEKNTQSIEKLSKVNRGIYEKLKEIEENMIDEQDTSIDFMVKQQIQKQQEQATKNINRAGLGPLLGLGAGVGGAGATGLALKKLKDKLFPKKTPVETPHGKVAVEEKVKPKAPKKLSTELKQIEKPKVSRLSRVKAFLKGTGTAEAQVAERSILKGAARTGGKALGPLGFALDYMFPDSIDSTHSEERAMIGKREDYFKYRKETDFVQRQQIASIMLEIAPKDVKEEIQKDLEMYKNEKEFNEMADQLRELQELSTRKMDPEQKEDILRRMRLLKKKMLEHPYAKYLASNPAKSVDTSLMLEPTKGTPTDKAAADKLRADRATKAAFDRYFRDRNIAKASKTSEYNESFGNAYASAGKTKEKKKESKGNNVSRALNFFVKAGFTKAQSAAIVGNLQVESGQTLDHIAVNKAGRFGIAQWDTDRQGIFNLAFGKEISDSSFVDQLRFIMYEFNEFPEFGLEKFIKTETLDDAVKTFEEMYLQMNGQALDRRLANAKRLYGEEKKFEVRVEIEPTDDAFNKIQGEKPETPTKSTPEIPGTIGSEYSETKPDESYKPKGKFKYNGDKVAAAMRFFMSKGWTKEQAAGILGNLLEESGLNTQAHNPKEDARGIAQWRNERITQFEKMYKKPLFEATLEEQLAYVDWELKNSHRKAGNILKTLKSIESSTKAVDKYYEVSYLGAQGLTPQKRIDNAYGAYSKIGGEQTPPVTAETPEISKDRKMIESQQIEQAMVKNTTAYDKQSVGVNSVLAPNVNINSSNNNKQQPDSETAFNLFVDA